MTTPFWMGWDLGGAHIKVAVINEVGHVVAVRQEPCPLWQGIDRLEKARNRILADLKPAPSVQHALTMTGELTDYFTSRSEGVTTLIRNMQERLGPERLKVFAGKSGFLEPDKIHPNDIPLIASANWLASGLWTAAQVDAGLFVDIGSTTTDLLPFRNGSVHHRGYTDHERMRYDELIYTGIVRTPLMALAGRVPLNGEWVPPMAEQFATLADVYRLSGDLDDHMDLLPTADQGAKTVSGSCRRVARQFGLDADTLPVSYWNGLARFLKARHIETLLSSIELQLSRGLLSDDAPLIGAGIGRFLIRELAGRLARPHLDFGDLLPMPAESRSFRSADCAPAAAVACLAFREFNPR